MAGHAGDDAQIPSHCHLEFRLKTRPVTDRRIWSRCESAVDAVATPRSRASHFPKHP
jgi:hypothetical protein